MIKATTETIKTIIISKFKESTHHMNEFEMKKKLNSQDNETDSYNLKYRLKTVSILTILLKSDVLTAFIVLARSSIKNC